MSLILFNNCDGRDHAVLYDDENAYFDLNTTGRQANQAKNLVVGQTCVVCQPMDEYGRIRFDWYVFEEERLQIPIGEKNLCRVFVGTWQRAEILPHEIATRHAIYCWFFDKLKRFKQTSALIV